MALQIIPFQSSINTCYLIRDRGAVLIDSGYAFQVKQFSRFLGQHRIKPEEIRLIIITHADFDHVGGAKELKELTGASIAIHEHDRKYMEEGIFRWPQGVTRWGRISRAIFKRMLKRKIAFPPVKADVVLDDNDRSLEEFGITGKIIYTPGHTDGSVSVLLDSGEAFIGCLAHNRLPLVIKPSLPIYAENIELVKKSLRNIIDRGAKILYPGHGKPIPVEKMLKYCSP